MDRELLHKLNNALFPVRAYGELALRKLERGEDPRLEIEEALHAVDRATALAGALLRPAERSQEPVSYSQPLEHPAPARPDLA